MTTTEISSAKSMFASIDKRSDEFTDDVALAKNFTALILGGNPDVAADVGMVHLTSGDDIPKIDSEGKEYARRYAIWKEGQNYFGAWVYFYDEEWDDDKVIYPHILGPVTKKSHEIVEDVYYIAKLGLPVAWVTYHDAQ